MKKYLEKAAIGYCIVQTLALVSFVGLSFLKEPWAMEITAKIKDIYNIRSPENKDLAWLAFLFYMLVYMGFVILPVSYMFNYLKRRGKEALKQRKGRWILVLLILQDAAWLTAIILAITRAR